MVSGNTLVYTLFFIEFQCKTKDLAVIYIANACTGGTLTQRHTLNAHGNTLSNPK